MESEHRHRRPVVRMVVVLVEALSASPPADALQLHLLVQLVVCHVERFPIKIGQGSAGVENEAAAECAAS